MGCGNRKTYQNTHRDINTVFLVCLLALITSGLQAAVQMARCVYGIVETGKYVKMLTGRMSSVSNLSFNSDNLCLAIAISDATVQLWNVTTGIHSKTLTGHKHSVSSLSFSPNALCLASGSGDGTVWLWDVKTGKHIKTLMGHMSRVESVSFSPDGQTLASGSGDGTVLLWDVDTISGKTIFTKEETAYQNRASQIQQICEDRGITTLVHFTRIENLRSILHEGLLDHQSLLKKYGQQFAPNDRKRLDRYKEAICLSISFPNYELFFKFSRPDYSQWDCSASRCKSIMGVRLRVLPRKCRF